MLEMELDNRGREILREIIRNFIHSGEPVGSRTISKIHPEGLSAASIRNIMADLEEMGYLMQPHTSAGRVPTDRGYRYYVDSLLTGIEVPRSDRERVAEAVRGQGALPEVLAEISRVISSITHQVGFVIPYPATGSRESSTSSTPVLALTPLLTKPSSGASS